MASLMLLATEVDKIVGLETVGGRDHRVKNIQQVVVSGRSIIHFDCEDRHMAMREEYIVAVWVDRDTSQDPF